MTISHMWRGSSKFNRTAGMMNAVNEFGYEDDILAGGHIHVAQYFKHTRASKVHHLCQLGAFKVKDIYPADRGFLANKKTPVFNVVVDPLEPDLTKRVRVFDDDDDTEAREYLARVRSNESD